MIGGTRIKVEYIAIATQQGEIPEQICESYQGITLGQVHSALAYYWDNKVLVDRLIKEGERMVDEMMNRNVFHQPNREELVEKWRAKKAKAAGSV